LELGGQRSEVRGQRKRDEGRWTREDGRKSGRIKESPATRSVEPDTPVLACHNVLYFVTFLTTWVKYAKKHVI
jgi:hypothetical protein